MANIITFGGGSGGGGSPSDGAITVVHSKLSNRHELTGEIPGHGIHIILFVPLADWRKEDELLINGIPYALLNIYNKKVSDRAFLKDVTVSMNINIDSHKCYMMTAIGGHDMLDQNYYNFPLSIQLVQPEPIVDGHIWIKSARQEKFNKIYLDNAIRVSQEDNSLIFLMAQNDNSFVKIVENRLTNNSDSDTDRALEVIDVLHLENEKNNTNWAVGYNVNTNEIRKYKPLVYSKVAGKLDIETAYMWDIVQGRWEKLSENGRYLVAPTGNGIDLNYIYINEENLPDTLANNTNFNRPVTYCQDAKISPNGSYIVYLSNVSPYIFAYKRNGNVFAMIDNLEPLTYGCPFYYGMDRIAFNSDGSKFAVADGGDVVIYDISDTEIVLNQRINLVANSSLITTLKFNSKTNILYVATGYNNAAGVIYWLQVDSEGAYSKVETNKIATTANNLWHIEFTKDCDRILVNNLRRSSMEALNFISNIYLFQINMVGSLALLVEYRDVILYSSGKYHSADFFSTAVIDDQFFVSISTGNASSSGVPSKFLSLWKFEGNSFSHVKILDKTLTMNTDRNYALNAQTMEYFYVRVVDEKYIILSSHTQPTIVYEFDEPTQTATRLADVNSYLAEINHHGNTLDTTN